MNCKHALIGLVYLLGCQTPPSDRAKEAIAPETHSLDTTRVLTTIAFGSCNRSDHPQPLWSEVIAQQPDLWIWLGDNVYADTYDMDVMRQTYQQQLQRPEYQSLLAAVPVVGIWDDHDYGVNDGGRHYPKKEASRDLLLEFLAVDADRPVWGREGAYQSYTFGPAGKRVKVILLDTRYFRDTLVEYATEDRRYGINPQGDILGEEQWQWLADELTFSEAQLHIIGSSIQVIAEDHGFEKWANFPRARQRLFSLIAESNAQGVVLLSGDRHIGEISRVELPDMEYPLYDITSSGLTHSYEEADEENRHRVSDLVTTLNYGLIQIDWQRRPPQVTYQIRGKGGATYSSQVVTYP